jgi:hypothetical protein
MRFGLVADVLRHLKALYFVSVASDFGILTNSATDKLNCAEVLVGNTVSAERYGYVDSSCPDRQPSLVRVQSREWYVIQLFRMFDWLQWRCWYED